MTEEKLLCRELMSITINKAEKALISRRTDPGRAYNVSDFRSQATLGEGGFGKVELVKHKDKSSQYYARKKISKKHATDVELETKIMQNEELNNFIGM